MKSHLSILLAGVAKGEEIAINRHDGAIARLVPERPEMAVDVFRPFWGDRKEIDMAEPADASPDPVGALG